MRQPSMFKLDQNPKGRGLRYDNNGLFLGRCALLQRDGCGDFRARPDGELRKIFGRVCGCEADRESRIRSVKLVARALNSGDMARATMTAVLMRLPEPGGPVRIADGGGVLAKAGFNPDELRNERGLWAGDGDANEAQPGTSRDPHLRLAEVGRSDTSGSDRLRADLARWKIPGPVVPIRYDYDGNIYYGFPQ